MPSEVNKLPHPYRQTESYTTPFLSMGTPLSLLILLSLSAIAVHGVSEASPVCSRLELGFIESLKSQCPQRIELSSAIEVPPITPSQQVSGDTLDGELGRGQDGVHYAVLFYASWCPFSHDVRHIFYALGSMYPQMVHLAVEESAAMPSAFSRYGVHSFPTILVVSETATVRYYGSKDLRSLAQFYQETTGLDPIAKFDVNEPNSLGNSAPLWPWNGSAREIVENEPYLALSLLFIILKALIVIFRNIIPFLKLFWVSFAFHLNLGMFGESSHLLARALPLFDVKKQWDKFRLYNKARNFQNSAKNARVWASSLASVLLGESSAKSAYLG